MGHKSIMVNIRLYRCGGAPPSPFDFAPGGGGQRVVSANFARKKYFKKVLTSDKNKKKLA